MRLCVQFGLVALALVVPVTASAQPLIAGPGAAGYDAALEARAESWVRLQQGILSVPLGFGLEAFVSDPADRAAIEMFVASGERDVMAATGQHPYALVDRYNEVGDLGMFGGVQAAGDAFRYRVLRDSGAPSADVAAARAALVRALDGLHWQMQITGEPGVVARGIGRLNPLPGEPPVPGAAPELVPLRDAAGEPQPADKEPTFRADNSGELPDLYWLDDCSKDQLDGYVFALGAMFDAVNGDPEIDPALVARLVQDSLALGRSLMERRVINGRGDTADLTIIDADGRLTTFHAMSAEESVEGAVTPRPMNGFNGALGLGAIRTLYHITGDEELGRFYYEDLLGRRGYMRVIRGFLRAMYLGAATNYSNVNMAFVGLWGLVRYETDDAIANEVREIMADEVYRPDVDRAPVRIANPFFDLMYAGFPPDGEPGADVQAAIDRAMGSFADYPAAPVWNPRVEHCDDAEIASLSCVANDGTPMTLLPNRGHNDQVVAADPLPMRIRPPSNFVHRSDPHQVNGGGGDRLNPSGSMHAAYWMGRLLERGGDNRASGLQRVFVYTPPPTPDAGPAPDAGTDPGEGGGCTVRPVARGLAPGFGVLALLCLLTARRRSAG